MQFRAKGFSLSWPRWIAQSGRAYKHNPFHARLVEDGQLHYDTYERLALSFELPAWFSGMRLIGST